MQRLFVAIDLSGQQKEQIGSICYGLPGARWTPPEQTHLTLRFIGEVDGSVFRQIKDSLGDIRSEPFILKPKGLGFFPPRRSPRVLWIGTEHCEPLLLLRNRVESNLVKAGIRPEGRKFSPHITIARLSEPSLPRTIQFLASHNMFETAPLQVDEIHLYSSHLTAKGAIHQIEASYQLHKSAP